MTPKNKYKLRVLGLSLVVALSFASFAYLNSIDSSNLIEHREMFSEDVEEPKDDLLPDVHLLKMLMEKTLEFVTYVQPL